MDKVANEETGVYHYHGILRVLSVYSYLRFDRPFRTEYGPKLLFTF